MKQPERWQWSKSGQLFHTDGFVFGVAEDGRTINLGKEIDVTRYLETGVSKNLSLTAEIILNTAKNVRKEVDKIEGELAPVKKRRVRKIKVKKTRKKSNPT